MGWGRKVKAEAATAIRNLYRMFLDTDATLVEVNPFAETPDGRGTTHTRMYTSLHVPPFVAYKPFRLPPQTHSHGV